MFRKLKLKTRMILVLGLVSAVQTGLIGGFAWQYLSRSLDDQIGQRALMVAKTIAAMPGIINGIEQRDTAALQRLSEKLARTNEALFIVIGDANNIRLAHPNPDQHCRSLQKSDFRPGTGANRATV